MTEQTTLEKVSNVAQACIIGSALTTYPEAIEYVMKTGVENVMPLWPLYGAFTGTLLATMSYGMLLRKDGIRAGIKTKDNYYLAHAGVKEFELGLSLGVLSALLLFDKANISLVDALHNA